MKTAVNFRPGRTYKPEAEGKCTEMAQRENPLSEKIEVLKESMLRLILDLDQLRAIVNKIEVLKGFNVVIGEEVRVNFHEIVRHFEIDLINRALQQTGGHQIKAARLLGMNVTTLNSMIKRYRIDPQAYAVRPPSSTRKDPARRDKTSVTPLKDVEQEMSAHR